MDSTWETRELPVLAAAVRWFDDPDANTMNMPEIVQWSGLQEDDVKRALRRLDSADPPYLQGVDTAEFMYPVGLSSVTERALRAVGVWPTPDSLADRIIAALEEAAANGETEEERSRAQKMLDGAKGVGKGVLTGVLVKVMTGGV